MRTVLAILITGLGTTIGFLGLVLTVLFVLHSQGQPGQRFLFSGEPWVALRAMALVTLAGVAITAFGLRLSLVK